MALSSPWLTVGEAASFLRRTEREVLALIYAGELEGELRLDHYDVSRESVEAYARRLDKADASELATRTGDVLAEHATRPSVGGGPSIGHEADLDYQGSKEDA